MTENVENILWLSAFGTLIGCAGLLGYLPGQLFVMGLLVASGVPA